ncbi:hypothetical protein HPB50_014711 [Hyalomma asiaticum]|uniref:Uncharacterized protein n=1 Tax=Hyalomma asiaticum TaxID=266040 RepID=A0ACB7RNS2_HYAAI|nr:hypothetical protein HPB50_014711 [Hyalomma asiaticum]
MSQGEDDFLSGGQWKGQLDLDRPCRALSSDETCWLCDDFTAWNPVMYQLDLQLAETTPGTMLLRCISEPREDRDPVTAARQTSWLASWLLCHHTCIQELAVECAIGTSSPAAQPSFPIFLRRRSSSPPLRRLRSLRIIETPRSSAHRISAHLVPARHERHRRPRHTVRQLWQIRSRLRRRSRRPPGTQPRYAEEHRHFLSLQKDAADSKCWSMSSLAKC